MRLLWAYSFTKNLTDQWAVTVMTLTCHFLSLQVAVFYRASPRHKLKIVKVSRINKSDCRKDWSSQEKTVSDSIYRLIWRLKSATSCPFSWISISFNFVLENQTLVLLLWPTQCNILCLLSINSACSIWVQTVVLFLSWVMVAMCCVGRQLCLNSIKLFSFFILGNFWRGFPHF